MICGKKRRVRRRLLFPLTPLSFFLEVHVNTAFLQNRIFPPHVCDEKISEGLAAVALLNWLGVYFPCMSFHVHFRQRTRKEDTPAFRITLEELGFFGRCFAFFFPGDREETPQVLSLHLLKFERDVDDVFRESHVDFEEFSPSMARRPLTGQCGTFPTLYPPVLESKRVSRTGL